MSSPSATTDTSSRYPDYDVMSKWDTPSWNDTTRAVVSQRLTITDEPKFFSVEQFRILQALCDRIIPQPASRRNKVPLAGMVDRTVAETRSVGYRPKELPPLQEAWRRGLHALDEEAKARFGAPFTELAAGRQDTLLELVQKGDVRSSAWDEIPAKPFFKQRVLHDVTTSYFTHPTAWNEIGFGGPASPRGYVRLGTNRRDAWEAKENKKAAHRDD